jgi:hypothetical protein
LRSGGIIIALSLDPLASPAEHAFDSFLLKPFSTAEVDEVIRRRLARCAA